MWLFEGGDLDIGKELPIINALSQSWQGNPQKQPEFRATWLSPHLDTSVRFACTHPVFVPALYFWLGVVFLCQLHVLLSYLPAPRHVALLTPPQCTCTCTCNTFWIISFPGQVVNTCPGATGFGIHMWKGTIEKSPTLHHLTSPILFTRNITVTIHILYFQICVCVEESQYVNFDEFAAPKAICMIRILYCIYIHVCTKIPRIGKTNVTPPCRK